MNKPGGGRRRGQRVGPDGGLARATSRLRLGDDRDAAQPRSLGLRPSGAPPRPRRVGLRMGPRGGLRRRDPEAGGRSLLPGAGGGSRRRRRGARHPHPFAARRGGPARRPGRGDHPSVVLARPLWKLRSSSGPARHARRQRLLPPRACAPPTAARPRRHDSLKGNGSVFLAVSPDVPRRAGDHPSVSRGRRIRAGEPPRPPGAPPRWWSRRSR